MRRSTFSIPVLSIAVGALGITSAGCDNASDNASDDVTTIQSASVTTPQTPLSGNTVPKFVDALPTFNGRRSDGTTTQQITMQEFQQKVLPNSVYAGRPAPFNNGTFLWGYNINGQGASWPSRTIESRKGVATTAIYTNSLANTRLQSLLTVDQTIHWADPLGTTAHNNCVNGPPLAAACTQPFSGPIAAVVHLHGNEVLSQYDGHPDAWWTPGVAQKGRAFFGTTYNYVNQQEATTLWFHDHALGTVRLNVYAGLAGFYLIRDNRDTGFANNPITLPAGPYESEMMLADRQFDTNGQLYFPDSDNPANLNGPPGNPDKHPFWIPEFFGDVITVNGKSWPTMSVEPRRYRFRWVNASNARFYTMQLFNQQGVDMHTNGPAGPAIWQIGSDGGLFNNPVKLADPANGNQQCAGEPIGNNTDVRAGANCLFLAPAERADVIIDFSGQAGRTFTLKNFAVLPFPSGGPVGFGAPDATSDGLVMQFRVNLPLQGTDTSFNPAGTHPPLRATPIVNIKSITPERAPAADPRRGRRRHDQPGRPGLARRRRRSRREPDQQHQVERQPRRVDHHRAGLAIERPRRVRDGDAAPGRDRAMGGREHHGRRASDSHPPDPVPGDLAPDVRPRRLPDRLDGGVPGRHVQRLHLPGGRVHPGLRAAAQLPDPQRGRRGGRQPELQRRQVPAARRVRGRRVPVARARGNRRRVEGHDQDVPG